MSNQEEKETSQPKDSYSAIEEALKRSQEMYARAEAIAHIGIWDWDILTGELRWTDEIFRIFGLEPRSFDATYNAFLEKVHPDDRQAVIQAVDASLKDPQTPYDIEHRIVRPDQSTRIVHEQGQVYYDQNNYPIRMIGTVHDITKRVHAESALRFTQYAVDNASDAAYWIRASDGRFLYVNNTSCALLGYTKEELLTMGVADINPEYPMERWQEHVEKVKQQERMSFETYHRNRQGRVFPVEINTHYTTFEGQGYLIGFARDITERKQTEAELERYREHLEQLVQDRTKALEAAQQELLQRERLATLGQLIATVSHELRNPLSTMRLLLYILEKETVCYSKHGKKALSQLECNITRCDHIIDELLDFTRIRDLQQSSLKLDPWLTKVLEEQPVPQGVTRELNLRLEHKHVSFDPDRLRRAVINVYDNACQALEQKKPNQPTLRIKTYFHEDRVWLEFSDNGPGIPDDIMPLIFEPLYSTKTFGVGLGLTVVQQIMEKHNGGVHVQSQPQLGTTLRLWLPTNPDC